LPPLPLPPVPTRRSSDLCGPTPRAVVAVRGPQLSDGSTEVERPRIEEGRVRVGIERPFLRQASSGPILPPVEIPLEALIKPAFVDRKSTRLNSSHVSSSY